MRQPPHPAYAQARVRLLVMVLAIRYQPCWRIEHLTRQCERLCASRANATCECASTSAAAARFRRTSSTAIAKPPTRQFSSSLLQFVERFVSTSMPLDPRYGVAAVDTSLMSVPLPPALGPLRRLPQQGFPMVEPGESDILQPNSAFPSSSIAHTLPPPSFQPSRAPPPPGYVLQSLEYQQPQVRTSFWSLLLDGGDMLTRTACRSSS